MFIEALFTTPKTWKQPKYPLTGEWIKKMWYTYTMEYYSAIKRSKLMPLAATWMDPENVMLCELSQTGKEKYCMTFFICGIVKGMIQINLLTKQKETHTLREQANGCHGDGMVREFWMDMYTQLYLKWIICKDLLYRTCNSAQGFVAAWMGGGLGANEYIYITQSCPTVCDPMNTRLLHPRDFLGKSTGVGCYFLLQYVWLLLLSRFSRVRLCATP